MAPKEDTEINFIRVCCFHAIAELMQHRFYLFFIICFCEMFLSDGWLKHFLICKLNPWFLFHEESCSCFIGAVHSVFQETSCWHHRCRQGNNIFRLLSSRRIYLLFCLSPSELLIKYVMPNSCLRLTCNSFCNKACF